MGKLKYKPTEVRKMESEIAPLVELYHRAKNPKQRCLDPKIMGEDQFKRLRELSDKLSDYYASHRSWKSYGDYFRAIVKVDPFGMFWHRDSVRIRCVKINPARLTA